MKFLDALRIINGDQGFMVAFERVTGHIRLRDHFPDKHAGEKLIVTEELAWEYARKFADNAPDSIVNIYVTHHDFVPVAGYQEKMLRRK